MAHKLQQQLKELGSKLETPPSTKDALVKLLKQAATSLSEMEQSPPASVLESMKPFLNVIVKPELLKHQDRDVKLLVATCVCEITRITAPEAPYSDDVLKDIFQLIVGTFSGLSDTSGPSFGRRVAILETLAKYRSCVVMLDLECDGLVNEMFSTFFAIARDDHPESVLSSMQMVMVVLLEESEDVRDDLLYVILSALGRDRSDVTKAARRLAMNVIQQCEGKLEPGIKQFILSSMSADSKPANSSIQYHEVIYDLYICAPQILAGVVPYITGELLTDQLEPRLKAVNLVGDLFSLPGCAISEEFQPVFSEFLKRLTDRAVEVRMSVLEHVKGCLLSNPYRTEASEIISALCDRVLDFDENVRKQVVAVICDVACCAIDAVPVDTVKLVAERLRDKSLLVKKYTMERLVEIYKVYCEKSLDSSYHVNEFDWIPGKILRCFYGKDFRSDDIESLLCISLFPAKFSIKDRTKHWIEIFMRFDKVEVRALEKVLEQKQRLQQEMHRYLSLRQDKDAPEVLKKILFCFRVMSRSFADPVKTEENFQILDNLKDANIWKILMQLVDPNTGSDQAFAHREDLLQILGEKHRLYDFLSILCVKCSYLLFDKEHVKAILSETTAQKSAGNAQYVLSCMNLLGTLARFSPSLLCGSEEELVNLLKDDNDIIKEGILHVLAKAGGTIREQLAVSSSSIDLILERLCLEGSRRQAKYAVHALAAITKDDGLKSLSVLYKRLVDMLEEKTHLPSVLQSLGCIAETAMPVFETRESEIVEFILNKILKCDSKSKDDSKASWKDGSEICLLKIYGIKTLVKSYLPVKDAHVRPNIDGLLDILRNILSLGEISRDIKSSSVDMAHLRLASAKAVLRLSKHWDDKIPIDIFHLTLRATEINFPQAKKIFLSKVHQYIKDRHLDAKYACVFLFNIFGSKPDEFAEDKHNLVDVVQMLQQAKARQLSMQCDAASSTSYPEYILPYLVHALAHISCPDVDECKDFQAYDLIYRQLYLFLSVVLNRDDDTKSEATMNKEKESISAIVSIFQSIKHSEDVVDAAKSKNSHAICDLGLSIVKRIIPKDFDLQGLALPMFLPAMLYKAHEKKEGEDSDSKASEAKSWLIEESVLAHFESLELEMVPLKNDEDEIMKDVEGEGKEIPLGKMIKYIKSRGTKRKKNKVVSAETKKDENDVDILNMVRQINLDNLETSTKFGNSNGHEQSSGKQEKMDSGNKSVRKRKAGEASSSLVPKRKRSVSTHSKSPRSMHNASLRLFGDASNEARVSLLKSNKLDTEVGLDKKSLEKKLVKGAKSDLLVLSLKHKVKGSGKGPSEEANEVEESDEHELEVTDVETDKIMGGKKTSAGSSQKRKRKSIAGLSKCTSKEGGSDVEDFIGCRIKVWWPLDKTFYTGTVKSYDSMKGKHVILYDDGDVEILRLEKERWELIDKGRKSSKKSKSSKGPLSLEMSSREKNKNSGGSNNKKSPTLVNGKKKLAQGMKRVQDSVSRSKFHQEDDKDNSELSNLEEATPSKGDDPNSGGSEEEQPENSESIPVTRKGSHTKVKSALEEKQFNDMEESDNHTEEPDPEKFEHGGRLPEEMEGIPEDAQDMEEQRSSSEEKEKIGSEDMGEEAGEDILGSAGNIDYKGISPPEVKRSHQSSDASDSKNAGISDDEPLSKWKHRAGVKNSRRTR